MVSISEAYNEARKTLEDAEIESFVFEARQLTEHFLELNPHDISLKRDEITDEEKLLNLRKALKKRCEGYPLQYIIGEWEFYGYPFKVGEGVLIPRQDTETIVDAILNENKLKSPVIADLCSGSGCIAITLKKEIPEAEVYAVEKSELAFSYLKENAYLNGAIINAFMGDIFDKDIVGEIPKVDILVSNPPYLTKEDMEVLQKEVGFEPETALYGGDDGLYFYRRIPEVWRDKINEGGEIIFEIGINQEGEVGKFLRKNNFKDIKEYKDLNGIVRAVSATK